MYRLDDHSSSDFPFGNVVVMAAVSGEKSKVCLLRKTELLSKGRRSLKNLGGHNLIGIESNNLPKNGLD